MDEVFCFVQDFFWVQEISHGWPQKRCNMPSNTRSHSPLSSSPRQSTTIAGINDSVTPHCRSNNCFVRNEACRRGKESDGNRRQSNVANMHSCGCLLNIDMCSKLCKERTKEEPAIHSVSYISMFLLYICLSNAQSKKAAVV